MSFPHRPLLVGCDAGLARQLSLTCLEYIPVCGGEAEGSVLGKLGNPPNSQRRKLLEDLLFVPHAGLLVGVRLSRHRGRKEGRSRHTIEGKLRTPAMAAAAPTHAAAKEHHVYLAKLTEQAERYDGACAHSCARTHAPLQRWWTR